MAAVAEAKTLELQPKASEQETGKISIAIDEDVNSLTWTQQFSKLKKS